MIEKTTGTKIIAVSDANGREAYFLREILSDSGRDSFCVLPLAEVKAGSLPVSVLLAPVPPKTDGGPCAQICVTRFHKDTDGEPLPEFPKVVTYSTEYDSADFTARNIRLLPEQITAFEIVGVGIIGRARISSPDPVEVEPALAASAAAIAAGVPFAEILEALGHIGLSGTSGKKQK